MMNNTNGFRQVVAAVAALMLFCSGCSKEEAAKQMKQVENTAKEASKTVAEDVRKSVEKGEQMAAKLGDQAMAFLSPLKEKIGNLDGLKDKPAELKKAVAGLIQSIENKAANIKLPESVSNAVAAIKEKLIGLEKDLEGEVEQAKIDERVKEIIDSVKSGLGISSE